jgi:hypothetical protein
MAADDLRHVGARWPGTACTSTNQTQTGVVLHMISCLSECGRVGMTTVGETPEQAMAIYERAQRILLDEARDATGR